MRTTSLKSTPGETHSVLYPEFCTGHFLWPHPQIPISLLHTQTGSVRSLVWLTCDSFSCTLSLPDLSPHYAEVLFPKPPETLIKSLGAEKALIFLWILTKWWKSSARLGTYCLSCDLRGRWHLSFTVISTASVSDNRYSVTLLMEANF